MFQSQRERQLELTSKFMAKNRAFVDAIREHKPQSEIRALYHEMIDIYKSMSESVQTLNEARA